MGMAQRVEEYEDLSYLERMIIDPREYFSEPSEILTLGSINYDEKIQLLENWKRSIEDLMRAQGEGMAPSRRCERKEHLEEEMEEVGKVLLRLHTK